MKEVIFDHAEKVINQVVADSAKRDMRNKYQFDNMEHNLQEQMKVLNQMNKRIEQIMKQGFKE